MSNRKAEFIPLSKTKMGQASSLARAVTQALALSANEKGKYAKKWGEENGGSIIDDGRETWLLFPKMSRPWHLLDSRWKEEKILATYDSESEHNLQKELRYGCVGPGMGNISAIHNCLYSAVSIFAFLQEKLSYPVYKYYLASDFLHALQNFETCVCCVGFQGLYDNELWQNKLCRVGSETMAMEGHAFVIVKEKGEYSIIESNQGRDAMYRRNISESSLLDYLTVNLQIKQELTYLPALNMQLMACT